MGALVRVPSPHLEDEGPHGYHGWGAHRCSAFHLCSTICSALERRTALYFNADSCIRICGVVCTFDFLQILLEKTLLKFDNTNTYKCRNLFSGLYQSLFDGSWFEEKHQKPFWNQVVQPEIIFELCLPQPRLIFLRLPLETHLGTRESTRIQGDTFE